MNNLIDHNFLIQKARWVRQETLKIHKIAPETRMASSLSCVEIFVALYYGKIISHNPSDIKWEKRDRFIISKGHGSISLYPILADLGYFNKGELSKVCQQNSFLGGIPDPIIPGFETINGSLGHGLGVACGMALALKKKNNKNKVFVLLGDGELFEGSVWESTMFAAEHGLDNLLLIIDNNKISMLDYCMNIIDLEPIEDKFKSFKWQVNRVNGHDLRELYNTMIKLKTETGIGPRVLIADTVKGKGIPSLENDPLCHVKSISHQDMDSILDGLR